MSEEEAGAAYDPRLCDETLRVVLCLLLALAAGERTVCGESGSAACVCDVQYEACLASERVTSTRGLAQGLSRLNRRGRLPAACWALCCERASAYIIAPASIRRPLLRAHTHESRLLHETDHRVLRTASRLHLDRGFLPIHRAFQSIMLSPLQNASRRARKAMERRAPRRVWRGREWNGRTQACPLRVVCVGA